jgi:hypothetical protein
MNNTSHSSSTDSVFILPLIPLIDYLPDSAGPEDEERATMSAGSDSDLDGSAVEAMD